MKTCSRCKKGKPVDAFNFRNKKLNLRQRSCRDCTQNEIRNHYKQNRKYYIKKAIKRNEKIKIELRNYILNFLSKHPCIDCGETDPIVLDFDHKANKTASISEILQNKGRIQTIKEEIKKCEVRCANCHRRKTAKDFKWYRLNQSIQNKQ